MKECKRLLIVDDVEINRAILRNIFESEYEIIEAEDGVAALEILRQSENRISAVVLDIVMPNLDGFGVLEAMRDDNALSGIPVIVETASDDVENTIRALELGAMDVLIKPFNVDSKIICKRMDNMIARKEVDRLAEQNRIYSELAEKANYDELTGLLNRRAFYRVVRERLEENPDQKYAIIYCDLDHFKLFNDTFGIAEGDRLLKEFAKILRGYCCDEDVLGHFDADHFVVFASEVSFDTTGDRTMWDMNKRLASSGFNFDFVLRSGIYNIHDRSVDVALMCDRALLALKLTKYKFGQQCAVYDSSMRDGLVVEQEITGEMETALRERQFEVHFQPQYNYATGALSGAEALVRWKHPTKGMIFPSVFIPIFERNGFIAELDAYVWDETCQKIRYWIDHEDKYVPISVSVNISRADLYRQDLCERLDALVKKYSLDPSCLKLEITESSYMEYPRELVDLVNKLHAFGFTVEMDDFGSGYSSLNTLKDLPVDVLKMDLRFLDDKQNTDRGGLILESIVRMAHWLNLPVIAEGVETRVQAEYLNSIGCRMMQGYYFAQPMPSAAFDELLLRSSITHEWHKNKADDVINMVEFLDPSTQTALVFNGFVGAAFVFEYRARAIDAVRVNDKFYEEAGITVEEFDQNATNLLNLFPQDSQEVFIAAIEKAIAADEEQECELTHYTIRGGKPVLNTVRNRLRLLAHVDDRYVFFDALENTTEKRLLERENAQNIERNHIILEGMNAVTFDLDLTTDTLVYTVYSQSGNDREIRIENYSKSLSVSQNIHPDSQKLFQIDRDAFEKLGKTGSFECLTRLFADDYAPTRLYYTSLMDDQGRKNRIVGRLDDIRAEKEAEQRFNDEVSMRKTLDADIVQYYRINLTNRVLEDAYADDALLDMACESVQSEFPNRDAWQKWYDVFNLDNLLSEYQKGRTTVEMQYVRKLPGKGMRWVRSTAVLMQKPRTDEVVAFLYIKDIDDEVIMHAIVDKTVNTDYEYLLVIDAQTGLARRVTKRPGDFNFWPVESSHYETDTARMIAKSVCERDVPAMLAACKIDNILAHLKSEARYILNYRLKPQLGAQRKRIAFSLLSEVQKLILCTRIDVTGEYDEQRIFRQQTSILSVIPVGIMSFEWRDGAFVVNYLSPSFLRMLGYAPEDAKLFIGRNAMRDLVYEEEWPQVEAFMAAAQSSRTFTEINCRHVTKQGEIRWFNVRINIVQLSDESPQVYCVYSDVTESLQKEVG